MSGRALIARVLKEKKFRETLGGSLALVLVFGLLGLRQNWRSNEPMVHRAPSPTFGKAYIPETQQPAGFDGMSNGVIFGYKFNDLNGNGQDDREPRIPGVTILLNGINFPQVHLQTKTNEDGEFLFYQLPQQSYSVCEVAVPPLVPTTPECVTVALFGKEPREFVSFGNQVQPSPSPTPSTSPSPTPSTSPSPTPSTSPSPTPTPTGCVRTQGFWGSSPAGQALVPVLVPTTLNLGSVAYTAAQLAQILDQPVNGNALLILGDQLIAAKLNILAGASSAPVSSTIASADSAIGSLVMPPIGSDFVAPSSTLGQTMTSLATTLDTYNNGNSGVPHCP